MTFRRHPDRLEHLFPRYWDNALTQTEAAELEALLAADPAARESFRLLCLQVVAASEQPALAHALTTAGAGLRPAKWSRRRVLQYCGAGLAAAAAGALAWRNAAGPVVEPLRLTAARGVVRLLAEGNRLAGAGDLVPAGGTVQTYGHESSAVLTTADGSSVLLVGDSAVTVGADGRRLVFNRGSATADVMPAPAGLPPLVLATAEAVVTALGGANLALGRVLRATEVGVRQGSAVVSNPAGVALADLRDGEILTVRADGHNRKQLLPAAPDGFAWDMTRPLPEGWNVGTREETADGPVVRPEFWFDPYHQAEMSQIRSDHQWTRGFVRLFPDSVFHVKCWVDRPGEGQLVVVVRTDSKDCSTTGVLDSSNAAFETARPGQWQWLTVRAGDMLDNRHAPPFGAPWVAFLVIFNTYQTDLGLRIADFRVSRPGGPVGGG